MGHTGLMIAMLHDFTYLKPSEFWCHYSFQFSLVILVASVFVFIMALILLILVLGDVGFLSSAVRFAFKLSVFRACRYNQIPTKTPSPLYN